MAVSTRERVIREVKRSALRSVRLSELRYRGRGITIDVAGVLVPVLNYQ
jgi:hypothetical protein